MTDYTVAEALQHLDPPIPPRTLQRRVRKLHPVGVRLPTERGGRPARTYNLTDIQRVHTEWAQGQTRKRSAARLSTL